jgi:multidrug efflux pump subunit AcrA (membrane-fusion protein)
MSLSRTKISWALLGGALLAAAGCGNEAPESKSAAVAQRIVPVTVAQLEHRAVERTVEVIGTLRGWEQVTLGSKRSGRVIKVLHDIGDRIKPGEPLVELDSTDAKLQVQEAESKYLGALVKLGITRAQAQSFVKQYGLSEQLVHGAAATELIEKTPSVVEKRLAREKKQQYLARQRALTHRGGGPAPDNDDARRPPLPTIAPSRPHAQ